MDRAREGGEEEEENEDEASDVAYVLRTIVALMIKTLPMNKSASGQGRSVIASIKGDE